MQSIYSNFFIFSIFLVIDMEVAKTATSFLTFWALIALVTLLLAGIVLDMA